jgi:hypothetical protein
MEKSLEVRMLGGCKEEGCKEEDYNMVEESTWRKASSSCSKYHKELLSDSSAGWLFDNRLV